MKVSKRGNCHPRSCKEFLCRRQQGEILKIVWFWCAPTGLYWYYSQKVCETGCMWNNISSCKSWLAGWGAAKSYWKDKAFLAKPAPHVYIHMHLRLHRNTHARTSTCVGIAVFVRNLHRLSFLFWFIWMLFAINNLGRINFELLSFWKLTRFIRAHAEVLCTHLHACALENRHTK